MYPFGVRVQDECNAWNWLVCNWTRDRWYTSDRALGRLFRFRNKDDALFFKLKFG